MNIKREVAHRVDIGPVALASHDVAEKLGEFIVQEARPERFFGMSFKPRVTSYHGGDGAALTISVVLHSHDPELTNSEREDLEKAVKKVEELLAKIEIYLLGAAALRYVGKPIIRAGDD